MDTFAPVSPSIHMKNSKKTLVILSPGFPANEMDSTCLPAQQALVKSMNACYPAINIIIIAFQYPYSSSRYQWHGNQVIPLNGRNRNQPYRWLVWLKAWQQLKKIQEEEQLLGILSFWLGECALIGHYFGKRKNLPHFTWILGQDARPGNRYAKWVPLHSKSLIAMSDFLARTFSENYGVKPKHTIPNGIDPAMYEPQQKARDIDIIGVGSLIPLKQYDLLINIVSMIRLKLPQLKVMICGKGPEQTHLEKLISEKGLDSTIELTGEKTHAEVLQLMQRSKLLLHTSSYEGFSGACLEALYAGTYVVSFFNPQDGWIRHWHIVEDEQAMIETALHLLCSDKPDHSPVLPYEMKDTAAAIMQLFTG
ncbi:MAG: glycosyltransferase family 4 protein [Sediminibacterium sp.]